MIPSIRHKMLDGLTRTREPLHLVKNDEAFPSRQIDMIKREQQHEKRIQIFQMLSEQNLHL